MEKDEIVFILREIQEDIQTIKRGVYGDKHNEVKGLIQTDRDQDARIKALEDTKKQAIWAGGGALILIEIAWQLFKTKVGL